jgi:hypothetical protein
LPASHRRRWLREFEAANDRIMGAAGQSSTAIEGINQAADQVDATSWAEKIATAIAAGFGAGYAAAQTWMEKVEEFVKTKLIVIGAALAAGITVAAASAIYAAYKIVSRLSASSKVCSPASRTSRRTSMRHRAEQGSEAAAGRPAAFRRPCLGAQRSTEGAGVGAAGYVSTLNGAEKAARTNQKHCRNLASRRTTISARFERRKISCALPSARSTSIRKDTTATPRLRPSASGRTRK